MIERPADKTLTDYMVIAISPALIMVLVGSLAYFLVTVFYSGKHESRMLWCTTAFVVGIVGIARISIEQGRERAALFALPLGIMTLLAMMKLIDDISLIGAMMVLFAAWYTADKLTWNCTVIDEEEDASGEGLLQHMEFDASDREAPKEAEPEATGATESESSSKSKAWEEDDAMEPRGWWENFMAGPRLKKKAKAARKKPQVPGLWVVYLCVIALPAFGVLNGMIAEDDLSRQSFVFRMLLIFVASALALLLTTSFLNLRRYLRQRHMEMPTDMAGTWLGIGLTLIVALVIFCLALPRPTANMDLIQWAKTFGTPEDITTSKMGMGKDGVDRKGPSANTREAGSHENDKEADAGKSGGKSGEQGGSSGNRSQDSTPRSNDSSSAENADNAAQESGEQSNSSSNSDAQSDSQANDAQQADQQQSQSQQSQQSQNATDPDDPVEQYKQDRNEAARSMKSMMEGMGETLGKIGRWLLVIVVIVVAIYWLAKNWETVLESWKKFLREIRDFWLWLTGALRDREQEPDEVAKTALPVAMPFAAFSNPFHSGMSEKASPDEIIAYSFQALEAWAFERGCPRSEEATAREFGRSLARTTPTIAREATALAELYNQVAYAKGTVKPAALQHVKKLWSRLDSAT